MYRKIEAAKALYDNPKKIEKIVETIFEDEQAKFEKRKEGIRGNLEEEGPKRQTLDLFQKIYHAETLYQDRPKELRQEIRAIFKEEGVEKPGRSYMQTLEALEDEKGYFAKHTIFGRQDSEYNSRVESIEQRLCVNMDVIKTKTVLQRWSLLKVVTYSFCGLWGMISPFTKNYPLLGFAGGLAVALSMDTFLLSNNRQAELRAMEGAKRNARKLDILIEQYM